MIEVSTSSKESGCGSGAGTFSLALLSFSLAGALAESPAAGSSGTARKCARRFESSDFAVGFDAEAAGFLGAEPVDVGASLDPPADFLAGVAFLAGVVFLAAAAFLAGAALALVAFLAAGFAGASATGVAGADFFAAGLAFAGPANDRAADDGEVDRFPRPASPLWPIERRSSFTIGSLPIAGRLAAATQQTH